MNLDALEILLPCHSLEDFPVYLEDKEADDLLACWSVLWHPALIATCGNMPSWSRVDEPPEVVEEKIIVIPAVSEKELPAGWAARVSRQTTVVRKQKNLDDMLAVALEPVRETAQKIEHDLVEQFLVLGFAYLQIELLTRQMHYMSHIDEVYFQEETLEAAQAAAAGQSTQAWEHLHKAFDILTEARDQFYPVDSFLIDLLFVEPTTFGSPFRQELSLELPTNVMLTGETLDRMAREEPQSLNALKHSLQAGNVTLVGGEYRESPLPLLSREGILSELLRGCETFIEHLGTAPDVYGRRGPGLTPVLPQILTQLGFLGAIHIPFSHGRTPSGDHAKILWEGIDGNTIDAISPRPENAAQPSSLLRFAQRMGETMNMDHVASVCYAHWPGTSCRWYQTLQKIAKQGLSLGKFVTLAEFFAETDVPDMHQRFEPDQYQTPYLKDAVANKEPFPLTRYVQVATDQAAGNAAHTLRFLREAITGQRTDPSQPGKPNTQVSPEENPATENLVAEQVSQQSSSDQQPSSAKNADTFDSVTAETYQLAKSIFSESPADERSFLLANPTAHLLRSNVQLPDTAGLAPHEQVRKTNRRGPLLEAIIDVPALGFASVRTTPKEQGNASQSKLVAQDNILCNEFFEAAIQPETGAIRAIRYYDRRGTQFSQQLAFRAPATRQGVVEQAAAPVKDRYSVMQAESCEVTSATPLHGEITSRGKLVDLQGRVLAEFQQRAELWRGSRVLQLEITITPEVQPGIDPWDSYYAARFAWANSTADIYRTVGGSSYQTREKRIEAPVCIDLRDATQNISIFTGGLPFHRVTGPRMLDTLLMVRGEQPYTARLGIGFRMPNPIIASEHFLIPTNRLSAEVSGTPSSAAGWLFHLSAKNVTATFWDGIWEGEQLVGFRARLLETEGKNGRCSLSAFQEIISAQQTDLMGRPLEDLPLEGGKIILEFAKHEWIQVEGRWK